MSYYYCGDFELNVCTGFRLERKTHSLLDDPRTINGCTLDAYILSTKRNAMFLFAIFGVKNY